MKENKYHDVERRCPGELPDCEPRFMEAALGIGIYVDSVPHQTAAGCLEAGRTSWLTGEMCNGNRPPKKL